MKTLARTHLVTADAAPAVDVPLIFPAAWRCARNPNAAQASERVLAWLSDLDIVRGRAEAERFRRMDVAGYGGWPFPDAAAPELETVTALFTLWMYYDESIEGRGSTDDENVARALRGESASMDAPHLRAFADIGQRFRARMSARWLDRHARHFSDWIASVRDEAVQVAAERAGSAHAPTLDAYLTVRAVNVGMYPTMDWIEYATGRELPDALLDHPDVAAARAAAALVVALTNDLYGYTKDRRERWTSPVTIFARQRGVSPPVAFAEIAALHRRAVAAVAHHGRLALDAAPDGLLLAGWLNRLYRMLYGFARWHEAAERYHRVHDFDGGPPLRLSIVV